MFNLLVYPYLSELKLMEQAVVWAIKNRTDEIIHVYFAASGMAIYNEAPKIEQRLNECHHHSKIILHSRNMNVGDFCNLSGDKGVMDLRRNIPQDVKIHTHIKRYKENIPVVFVGSDCKPIIFNKTLYDSYMNKIIEENRCKEEAYQQWRKQHQRELQILEEEKRRKREIANRTSNLDEKYFVSEETGHFYFYKPVDLERFSVSPSLLF